MRGKRIFRFDLVDFYDDADGEIVACADGMKAIKAAAKRRYDDTDGECALFVADWENRTLEHISI